MYRNNRVIKMKSKRRPFHQSNPRSLEQKYTILKSYYMCSHKGMIKVHLCLSMSHIQLLMEAQKSFQLT